MTEYGSSITHTCDNCHKPINKWQTQIFVRRYYTPGKNFDKCSSDIDAHIEKIAELCPGCMDELISLYRKESEDK